MSSLKQIPLQFNPNISFDFSGGNLSSDSGLILVKEFIDKLGINLLLKEQFDDDSKRTHTISSVIEQIIYQSIAGYHKDDAADDLRYDPVFTSILGKESLASQPTLSRVLHSFSREDAEQFNGILEHLYKKVHPENETYQIVLDLDSTNVQAYGKQEESTYIHHYNTKGYHPLVLYDGLSGDLMKFQLRKGIVYTSNGVVDFLEPVLVSLREHYPQATILVRGDSGFALPGLYDLCDAYGVHYIIKLKANAILDKLSNDAEDYFTACYKMDYDSYHCHYDEFLYQANSWNKSHRVVMKIERSSGELAPRKSYIITSLESNCADILKVYNKRGNMENFIKETKLDFGLDSLSHSTFSANQTKAMIIAVAYSIVNAMKLLVIPKDFCKNRMITLRTIFIKIASKFVSHSRKVTLKFCSSAPYKNVVNKIIARIHSLALG